MGWFPRFTGTVEYSESPTPVLLRLVVLRLCNTNPARIIRSPKWLRAAARGQETLIKRSPSSPLMFCELETPALPRFPGCPYVLALLMDPGRITTPSPRNGRCDAACWMFKAIGSYIFVISGLNHTARALAVYASQSGSPHDHARLATDLLATLWPRGTLTRWATMQSFWITLVSPSPLPELRLAQ